MSNVIDLSLKRGRIFLADSDTYRNIHADLYILCTTFYKKAPFGAVHSDLLAPTYDLFIQKNAWVDQDDYAEKHNLFKERYIDELATREDSQDAIIRLKELLIAGLDIVLFDDCAFGDFCHLNILGDYLKNTVGLRVYNTLQNKYALK